ncbi:MAG: sulfocyanin-like copper-binding protein [Gaiellaceae bacterium]
MLVAALAAAAIGGKPDPRQFLRVDVAHRLATLTLVAGYDGANNGFNFDGYGRGELLVTVPVRWRVRILCSNRSGLRNSCVVVRHAMTATPAFRGASTPNPTVGMPHGAAASFTFVAAQVGTYRLASLVPGQEEARLWDVLEVVRAGRPHATARPGP